MGEERTFDSVTIGGHTVWSSIADYQPPPLEVLRNPWIQWTVMLPRDISGPEDLFAGIHEVGPAALRALGVRDALTHMEWFRRPDGSVAVSEVAARPPGAQLTSMHGYSPRLDLFQAWAELVVLDRFEFRPSVATAAVGRTCGASARDGCARCTVSRSLQPAARVTSWWRRGCPSRASRPPTDYLGEGYVMVRDGDTEVVRDGARAASSARRAVELVEAL